MTATHTQTTDRSIFLEALDQNGPVQRAAYLDAACAHDPALRQRVEALLRSHTDAASFFDKLAPQRLAEDLAAEPTAGVEHDATQINAPALDQLTFLAPSEKPGSLGRLGSYEVEEIIGRGGMGIVLRAFDEKLHRAVAIKVMAAPLAANEHARRRFLREGRAAAAIRDDHVIGVYAVDEMNGLPLLVMEYIVGRSLAQRLESEGPLPIPDTLRIGAQIARGLAAAHAQGLVHRDIKPANILLENGVERVKITDFGLAHAVDDVRTTQPGTVVGTPEYMSPEQARGERVDHRSDLFSLGCVLYAICAGRPPFRAESTVAIIRRVCEDTPRPLTEINPDIPTWLAAVIDRLIAKAPEDRFQSASEVAELLEECLAHVQRGASVPPALTVRCLRSDSVLSTQYLVLNTALSNPKSKIQNPKYSALGVPHSAFTRWLTAALILVATTLALAESTGLTTLSSTIIRIVRGDGTLVIEVDDPNVQILVDGEELVITGAGPKELRLRPGKHELKTVKEGQPSDTKLITITQGGRQLVKVTREQPPSSLESSPGQLLRPLNVSRGYQTGASLSPDGSKLAFSNPKNHIIVRDLKTGKEQPFTQTEGLRPVFSPDARRIAYQAFEHGFRGDIRILRLATGEVQPTGIVGVPNDWSADGKSIVFVNPSDQEPRHTELKLLHIEKQQARTIYQRTGPSNFADWIAPHRLSPDGKHVVFSQKIDDNHDLYLLPIPGGEPVRITTDPAIEKEPLWSPDGKFVLFLCNRQLGRWDVWRIGVADGQPAGEPTILKADVGEQARLFSCTTSNQLLYSTSQSITHLFATALDPQTSRPQGAERKLTTFTNNNFWPVWSPDGKRISFISTQDGVNLPAVMSADGSGQRSFPGIKLIADPIAWLPDNNHLVFTGSPLDPMATHYDQHGIYSLALNTGEINAIYLNRLATHVDCSPDGKTLSYLGFDGLCTIGIDGQGLKEVTPYETTAFSITYPKFSSDGKELIYGYRRDGDQYRRSIMAISVDGGQPREIYGTSNPDEGSFFTMTSTWLPDGRLTFQSTKNVFTTWAVSSDGSGVPEKIDEGHFGFRVSPDGKSGVFAKGTGADDLWLMENFLPPLDGPKSDAAATAGNTGP